jgi:hypothetical protein
LSYLSQSNSLRAIILQGNDQITDNGLKYLAKMQNLEYIDLWNTNITDTGVRHLRPLKNLKRLNIRVNENSQSPPKITEAGLVAQDLSAQCWYDYYWMQVHQCVWSIIWSMANAKI